MGLILNVGLSPSPFCSTARRFTGLSKNRGASCKTGLTAIFGFPSTGFSVEGLAGLTVVAFACLSSEGLTIILTGLSLVGLIGLSLVGLTGLSLLGVTVLSLAESPDFSEVSFSLFVLADGSLTGLTGFSDLGTTGFSATGLTGSGVGFTRSSTGLALARLSSLALQM